MHAKTGLNFQKQSVFNKALSLTILQEVKLVSHKSGHKCTMNVWFTRVFKLSFSGAFARARIYAQNIALKTK